MCQHGPLSLIGPPCLLSPYRYCVSTTRAFSVPARKEGGRGGGRTEEGGGERGGKERRGEQMSVVRGSCGPWSLTKMSVFHYFTIFGRSESRVFGPVEGVFAGMQQSTVKVAVPGLSCCTHCQHNVTVYKQYRQEEATGAL